MQPSKILMENLPEQDFKQVVQFYQPVIEQRKLLTTVSTSQLETGSRNNTLPLANLHLQKHQSANNSSSLTPKQYSFQFKNANETKKQSQIERSQQFLDSIKKQKYVFQLETKDQIQMPVYMQEYMKRKKMEEFQQKSSQQDPNYTNETQGVISQYNQEQQQTLLESNQNFAALKQHLQKQKELQRQKSKDQENFLKQQSFKDPKLNQHFRQDLAENEFQISQQLKYQDLDEDGTMLPTRFSLSHDDSDFDGRSLSPIHVQMDTHRDSDLNTLRIQQLEEDLRFKNIIREPKLIKNDDSVNRQQKKEEDSFQQSSREGSARLSARNTNLRVLKGKKKKKKIVKIQQPTTAEMIDLQLEVQRNPELLKQLTRKVVRETEEQKMERIMKEEQERVQQENDRIQNSMLKKLVQKTKKHFVLQKSHRSTSRQSVGSSLEKMPHEQDDEVIIENSKKSSLDMKYLYQNKLQLQPPTPRKVRLNDIIQEVTINDSNFNTEKREKREQQKLLMKQQQDNKSNSKAHSQFNVDMPMLQIDLLKNYRQGSSENPLNTITQRTSRRPQLVDGESERQTLQQEVKKLITPRSPLKNNYQDSKVLMYKNLKIPGVLEGDDNTKNKKFNVMYNSEKQVSARQVKYEQKRRKKKKTTDL
eukprot:403347412